MFVTQQPSHRRVVIALFSFYSCVVPLLICEQICTTSAFRSSRALCLISTFDCLRVVRTGPSPLELAFRVLIQSSIYLTCTTTPFFGRLPVSYKNTTLYIFVGGLFVCSATDTD